MAEAGKPDLVEMARRHGLLGPPADPELQCDCVKETDFYARAAAFFKCVKSEEDVDVSDAAVLQRLRTAKKSVMECKEALAESDSTEDEESEEEEEEEEEASEEEGAAAAALLDPETEQLLRGAKDLVRQTAGLKLFLEDVLSEEGQGEPVVENSTITSIASTISAGRKVAELGEVIAKLGDEPDVVLPDKLLKTLDKCAQVLSEAGVGVPPDDAAEASVGAPPDDAAAGPSCATHQGRGS